MFFVSNFSFSQINTEWKTQGNTADSSTFIGTTNDACLRFRSNNIERMRISDEGNVGIGIENPLKRLDIDGDIQLTGDITFKGYENLQDTINRFLAIDKYGKTNVQSFADIRSYILKDKYIELEAELPLFDICNLDGGPAEDPSWYSAPYKLYTRCPDVKVGVGTTNPLVSLDVRGGGRYTKGVSIVDESSSLPSAKVALYIENKIYNEEPNVSRYDELILVKGGTGKKLLQLNKDGLLRAREIKVDMDTWPDYVFKKEYELLSLNEVKTFIDANGHLPNVPSAKAIEKEGLNLGDAAHVSMQKIEELTLYVLQINDKIEQQEIVLEEQQKLIQQQEETLRLQQQLIEELKQLTSKK